MKTQLLCLFLVFLLYKHDLSAQSGGYRLHFNNNNWTPLYAHSNYQVTNQGGVLRIDASNVGTNWANIKGGFPKVDMSAHPYVHIKIRTEGTVQFEIRVLDENNKETNEDNPKISISPQINYQWITYDFTNKFKQEWPDIDTIDRKNIIQFSMLINGGGNPDYTGWVEIDEIIIGDSSSADQPYDPVVYQPKVNQLGYFVKAQKVAIIPSDKAVRFYVVNKENNDTIVSKTSSQPSHWPYSEEHVVKADFSELEEEGTYCLLAEGLQRSFSFVISDTIIDKLLVSSLRAFYYNRASIDITEPYGGIWARAGGHPDNKVLVHSSATTAERPEGTEISSPKGWYDAGDYNKYVVPAGITLWQMLSCWEYFKEETGTLSLTIPESSNSIPDILDEALWEIEWLRTMQDPNDGGVYHKVTNAGFDDMIMPVNATQPRYVVQKSTPASLNFAAMLAKVSRIYKKYPELDANYSTDCLAQAERAWDWAVSHPDVQYDQESLNKDHDPDILTGDYGLQSYNIEWRDEWFWAAVELYSATGKQKYLDGISFLTQTPKVPSWSEVEFMGIISIIQAKERFSLSVFQQAQDRLMLYANMLKTEYVQSAYGIPLGASPWDISWNSNANAANQSMVLFHAYALTENKNFFHAAVSGIDYVLGRNPLNYCFATGFGSLSPKRIHHRISYADGITTPVPGLLVNGPHNTYLNFCFYPTTIPAFVYLDNECSAATNEVGIYGYSALVYALTALKHYYPQAVLDVKKKELSSRIDLFPNPNEGNFEIVVPKEMRNGTWRLVSLNGQLKRKGDLSSGEKYTFAFNDLPEGLYVLIIQNNEMQMNIKVIFF